MTKLLICSEADISSVNIRGALKEMREWDQKGDLLFHEDMTIMSTKELHISAESIDMLARSEGLSFDEIIFMSRHKAASGIPTLTVHPIGNFHTAEFGGRPNVLVKADPHSMSAALRELSVMDTRPFGISFEVTHHGPWLDTPTFFIEIGSDETQWGNRTAAEYIASALLNSDDTKYPVAIGMGGGHYAPRFTELALSHKVDFGHMIPNYAFKDSNDEDITRMISDSMKMSDADFIYVHKKSMKGAETQRILELITGMGHDCISSKDLEIRKN